MIDRYEKFFEKRNLYNTKVISAFPGCGKTTFFNMMNEKYDDDNTICIDSDSSKFSWVINDDGDKVRNDEFPINYINHIKENIGKYKYIFISTHDVVRDALIENEITFHIVYPELSMKEEYLERYEKRGNDENFIKLLNENWEKWIEAIIEIDSEFCKKIKLNINKPYLSDVLIDI